MLGGFSGMSDLPGDQCATWLTKEIGVAPVPGSSFYSRAELGRRLVRFAFCKTEDLLHDAPRRLARVRDPARVLPASCGATAAARRPHASRVGRAGCSTIAGWPRGSAL